MSIPAEFLAHRLADMARNGPTSTWRDDVRDAAIELERLDAWKREAMAVIGAWEKVWVALGEPGALGALKSTNSLAAVQQLVADRDRLRDAIAAHHDCCCAYHDGLNDGMAMR